MCNRFALAHDLGNNIATEIVIVVRLGFAFVHDPRTEAYKRKTEKRTTVIDLAESGYIVNIIDSDVKLDEVIYRYDENAGMIATDDKEFSLDINEFGLRR